MIQIKMQKLFIILCKSIHSSTQFTQYSRMQGILTWNRFNFSSTFFASFCLWPCTFIDLIFKYWTSRWHVVVLVSNHPKTLVYSISWIVNYCVRYLKFNSIKLLCFLWWTWREISWFLCRFVQIPSFLVDCS